MKTSEITSMTENSILSELGLIDKSKLCHGVALMESSPSPFYDSALTLVFTAEAFLRSCL